MLRYLRLREARYLSVSVSCAFAVSSSNNKSPIESAFFPSEQAHKASCTRLQLSSTKRATSHGVVMHLFQLHDQCGMKTTLLDIFDLNFSTWYRPIAFYFKTSHSFKCFHIRRKTFWRKVQHCWKHLDRYLIGLHMLDILMTFDTVRCLFVYPVSRFQVQRRPLPLSFRACAHACLSIN